MQRLGLVGAGLLVSVLAVAGCSSTAAKRQQNDGAALGTTYACTGGFFVAPDGSTVPVSADAGTSRPVCVVGQSYCMVDLSDRSIDVLPDYSCQTVPAGGLGVCADNPTCDCLCGLVPYCQEVNCACDGTGGYVTFTCASI